MSPGGARATPATALDRRIQHPQDGLELLLARYIGEQVLARHGVAPEPVHSVPRRGLLAPLERSTGTKGFGQGEMVWPANG